jgi:hypothetical protein
MAQFEAQVRVVRDTAFTTVLLLVFGWLVASCQDC